MNSEKYERIFMESSKGYQEACKALAPIEAEYRMLDGLKKSKFALAYSNTEGGSKGEREIMAHLNHDFIVWEDSLYEAEAAFLIARAKRDALQNKWETARSMLSMEKAKTNIL